MVWFSHQGGPVLLPLSEIGTERLDEDLFLEYGVLVRPSVILLDLCGQEL